MATLAHIVDTGRPAGIGWRHVKPPAPVEVDLRCLFPLPAHHEREDVPGGLEMRRVVVGRLTIWGRATEGDWWGLVTYPPAVQTTPTPSHTGSPAISCGPSPAPSPVPRHPSDQSSPATGPPGFTGQGMPVEKGRVVSRSGGRLCGGGIGSALRYRAPPDCSDDYDEEQSH